jgi:capsular exopolysaccharide synthesis family protein
VYKTRNEQAETELTAIQVALTEARARLRVASIQVVELSKPNISQIEKLAIIDDKNIGRVAAIIAAGTTQAGIISSMIAQTLPGIGQIDGLAITKLTELETGLAAKRQQYGENHEEVRQARIVLEEFKKSLANRKEEKPLQFDASQFTQLLNFNPDEVLRSYENMLRTEVKILESREQELLEIAETQKELARALDPYELEEQRLRDEVTRAQGFYDTALDQLRQINLAKDYSGFVNEIIDLPKFGSEVWPSVPVVMIVATMFGLLFGVGGAALTEYRDRSFRDPDDIRRDLGLTLLTHIPNLQGRAVDRRHLVEGSKMHATVYAYHRPKSREAEVFRGLRTSLFFSTQGQKCQVLGFTSPNQGDGKSTVTSNLAVSIAQTGRKVLLVDCDLRRPNVHKLLGVTNDVGLSDVIGGEMEPWDAIQQTETTNLWCLPSGPLPANPAELLTSAMFEEFIRVAREKFDYVLLDCPPVLAVADPCIVAPRTDGMTLVLRVSKDSRPQAQRAKEMLDRVHARMLGVVVNASQEAHKTGYGRYGESSHAYSYDYGYGGYGYSSYNKYYEDDTAKTARANRSGR